MALLHFILIDCAPVDVIFTYICRYLPSFIYLYTFYIYIPWSSLVIDVSVSLHHAVLANTCFSWSVRLESSTFRRSWWAVTCRWNLPNRLPQSVWTSHDKSIVFCHSFCDHSLQYSFASDYLSFCNSLKMTFVCPSFLAAKGFMNNIELGSHKIR